MNEDRKQLINKAMASFIHVCRQHRAMIDRETAKADIHRSQHRLLVFLSMQEKEPSQKEICEHFDISAATVAVTLKKLEQKGYIERKMQSDDNRVNRISITKSGRDELARTRELFDKCDEEAFDGFSKNELDTLVTLLDKMRINIEKAEESAKKKG